MYAGGIKDKTKPNLVIATKLGELTIQITNLTI